MPAPDVRTAVRRQAGPVRVLERRSSAGCVLALSSVLARAKQVARRVRSGDVFQPRMRSHERTVKSFDAVEDATLTPMPGVGGAPRFGTARTVGAGSHEGFTTFPAERQPERPMRVAAIASGRLMDDGGVVVTQDGSLVLKSLWDEEHHNRDY